jgi:hypothetical protein
VRAWSLSLDGYWRFEMDPLDAGERQQWFTRDFMRNSIRLPGILQSQNYGDVISTKTPWVLTLYDRFWYLRDEYKAYTEAGKVKVPFLSQPPRHYLGAVWYQREIQIQRNMLGRRIVLSLERPHWMTTVWVDDRKIGTDASLVAPHVYDLGVISEGRHRLTIRVDNRMVLPYRPDAHSVSDSVGASWNGIAGKIELIDTGRVWLDDVQVFPNLAKKSMLIKVRIGNATGRSGQGTVTAIWPDIEIVPASWDERGGTAEVEVPLRFDAETWDEFHPNLQKLRIWFKGTDFEEYKDLSIGLRDFHAEGKQFVVNGRPTIFRGTSHSGDYPLTGYPPNDVNSWRALFEMCKKWGLNHMRFHSWCPPDAAFEAADQIGFYLQLEPGMWNEISPNTSMERWLYQETDRMIRAYGNHPSFMLLSASNEPEGKWHDSLSRWGDHYRKEDPRRLYTTGSGHTEQEVIPGITDGADYLDVQRLGPMMLRGESGWFGADFSESLFDVNVPVISHEVGQWSAYPDYDIIKKLTGYMHPGNLEIFRDSLDAHGMLDKDRSFVRESGRFQLACYKEEIEANLRTPGLSGFQLLDLHDYLGQGTSFAGLFDALWQPKSYVTAQEFKDFCNTTVPLVRLPKRVFTKGEPFEVDAELANFGAEPIVDGKAVWRIGPADDPIAQGEWDTRTFPIGKNISLGRISVDLSKLVAPREYDLSVIVAPVSFFSAVDRKIIPSPNAVRGVTYFENHWNFWLYQASQTETASVVPAVAKLDPSVVPGDCPPSRIASVVVTRSWEEAEQKLAVGARVLFVPRSSDLDWSSPPLDTVPVFWNRQMYPSWGRMLGLWVDRKIDETKGHALDGFPTSSHFDWQWAGIIRGVRAVNLDQLPPDLEPTVWAIDDWNRNYKLGVIFECTVGRGSLLVSAIDVSRANDANPVIRQLRESLLQYAASDCFQPLMPVLPEQMRTLFFDTRIMKKLGAVAHAYGEAASAAIDGNPNTFWLTGDPHAEIREPQELLIDFPAPVAMSGVVLMPRQDHREHEGDIREFVLKASDDGNDWRDVLRGELVSTFAPQRIEFTKTITARYLKLISLSGFGADKTTALAELAVIYAGPKLEEKAR